MIKVVILRPSTDSVERTMSIWVDLLFPPGSALPGVQVLHDLRHGIPASFAQAACRGCDVILYFGHGTETTLGDPCQFDLSSIGSAAGSTVVAIACESGAQLGPQAVMHHSVVAYLGFTEPLFVYNGRPSVFGAEIASRIKEYLLSGDLNRLRDDLEADLQGIEALYRTGYYANHADSPLVWMGARMNWRGLVTH